MLTAGSEVEEEVQRPQPRLWGALELGWPFRDVPNQGKRLGW